MRLPIFGISGLRGIVPADISPETMAAVAAGFGTFTGPGAVPVGRDTRTSGEMVLGAAASGLASAGCEMVDLGICPTPTVLHYTRSHQAVGAIVITASHNPAEWNGMKFVRKDGTFLTADEVRRFRGLLDSGCVHRAQWNELAPARRDSSAIDGHITAIVSSELFRDVPVRLAGRRLRVAVDAVNGAAVEAGPRLVEALGAEVVRIFCDQSAEAARNGFPRRPEPVAAHLDTLCAAVREQGLDAGMAFDPDGDRFSCVDEQGVPLGEEATVCLACRYVLPRRPGKAVVNLSTTRAVEDVCAPFKAAVERTPVGEAAVVERIRAINAVVGGEGNGGVIVPEINSTRDGLVAAAVLLGLLAESRAPLSALRASLPRYEMEKTTVALSRDEFEARKSGLPSLFPGARVDTQDGLKIDGPDYWVHVRASNTEPLVRIIAEGRTHAQAEETAGRVKQALGKRV
jgi:phosphomannomutase